MLCQQPQKLGFGFGQCQRVARQRRRAGGEVYGQLAALHGLGRCCRRLRLVHHTAPQQRLDAGRKLQRENGFIK